MRRQSSFMTSIEAAGFDESVVGGSVDLAAEVGCGAWSVAGRSRARGRAAGRDGASGGNEDRDEARHQEETKRWDKPARAGTFAVPDREDLFVRAGNARRALSEGGARAASSSSTA